ncbi:MAG: TetR/AcrR family transcriptional regulator [Thermodesulfobacteriota bacterium]|nr:TetR/AcrR family transcriptional regulator [Thermodesulfobacteriota bacterium]
MEANAIRTFSNDENLVRERRYQIAEGALQLFVKQGYHQTSIRQIAQAANMSVGTLYHYIGSKVDILFMGIEDALNKVHDAIESASKIESPKEALDDAIERFIRAVDDAQDITVFAYQELRNLKPDVMAGLLDIDKRSAAIFEEIISKGVKQGEFREVDVQLAAHDIIVMGHMWAFRRWFLRKHYTLDQYIEYQRRFILNGILTVQE